MVVRVAMSAEVSVDWPGRPQALKLSSPTVRGGAAARRRDLVTGASALSIRFLRLQSIHAAVRLHALSRHILIGLVRASAVQKEVAPSSFFLSGPGLLQHLDTLSQHHPAALERPVQ